MRLNYERIDKLIALDAYNNTIASRSQPLQYHDWIRLARPAYNYDWPHLVHIIKYIQLVIDGAINRLIILAPPRHCKSETVTIPLPVYLLERYRNVKVALGAYNSKFAARFSRFSRSLSLERGLILNPEQRQVDNWEILGGGEYRSVGVGSGITGTGYQWMLIDDPVKSKEEADSEAYRDRVWYWFSVDMYTRLEPGGKLIIIMTPWHEDDLYGRIMQSEFAKDFTVVKLPAEAEEGDVLGREIGVPLCPDRFNTKALADIKSVLGNDYYALYQLRPSAQEGNIFNVKHFVDYEFPYPTIEYIVQFWDTAFKEGEDNDYSVCVTFGIIKSNIFIIDVFRDRLPFPELKRKSQELALYYNPDVILVEDAASGQSLAQELRTLTLNVIGIKPTEIGRDKVARANLIVDMIKQGRVAIPKICVWRSVFLNELAMFPNGKHDDIVDATVGGLWYIAKRFSNAFPIYPEF
ncbi:MAG: phage terminase large subunit, partial [Methylophilus sp.]